MIEPRRLKNIVISFQTKLVGHAKKRRRDCVGNLMVTITAREKTWFIKPFPCRSLH